MPISEKASKIDILPPEVRQFRRDFLVGFANSVLLALPTLDGINPNPILAAKEAARQVAIDTELRSRKADDKKISETDMKRITARAYENLKQILRIDVQDPEIENSPKFCRIAARFLVRESQALIRDAITNKVFSPAGRYPDEIVLLENLKTARNLNGPELTLGIIKTTLDMYFLESYSENEGLVSGRSIKVPRSRDVFDSETITRLNDSKVMLDMTESDARYRILNPEFQKLSVGQIAFKFKISPNFVQDTRSHWERNGSSVILKGKKNE